MLTELVKEAEILGFELPEAALVPLAGYLGDLVRWNKFMNLVGVSDWRKAFRTLIVDSLYLARFLNEGDVLGESEPLCWDLGSGAGLPGIPLRMLWQHGEYWLVESREKRALFLRTELARYPLPRTHVFHGRAEQFMGKGRYADIVVSRAFMPWEKLLVFVKPYLAQNARVVLLLNEPVVLPGDSEWRIVATNTYPVAGQSRMFTALTCA